MTTREREEEILQLAESLYGQSPDWITFYREILGLNGVVRKWFSTPDQLDDFEQTEAFREIQRMLTALREQKPPAANPEKEPTRVITVRIPKSVHDALRVEAHEHCTSMNKLCISKLLQFIDDELVPSEVERGEKGS